MGSILSLSAVMGGDPECQAVLNPSVPRSRYRAINGRIVKEHHDGTAAGYVCPDCFSKILCYMTLADAICANQTGREAPLIMPRRPGWGSATLSMSRKQEGR
jgi:hypothetical protein